VWNTLQPGLASNLIASWSRLDANFLKGSAIARQKWLIA
jgi:hypothetical protein